MGTCQSDSLSAHRFGRFTRKVRRDFGGAKRDGTKCADASLHKRQNVEASLHALMDKGMTPTGTRLSPSF